MRARVPQDVDLEDRVIFGLTPIRFGYLVIAVLGAMTCSRLQALPLGVRAVGCMVLLAAAAALAWARWRGRPLDQLLLDVLGFLWRSRRPRPRPARSRSRSLWSDPGPGGESIDLAPIARIGRRAPGPEEP